MVLFPILALHDDAMVTGNPEGMGRVFHLQLHQMPLLLRMPCGARNDDSRSLWAKQRLSA